MIRRLFSEKSRPIIRKQFSGTSDDTKGRYNCFIGPNMSWGKIWIMAAGPDESSRGVLSGHRIL